MMDPFPLRGRGDALDRLLEAAPLASPGPWFAARTLARCLSGQNAEGAPFRWSAFFPRWLAAGFCALLFSGLALQQIHREHTLETHRQQRVQEANEVMASLDDEPDAPAQDTSL